MAEARISQDEFKCPVCLDLLKDPVTTSCGHSYCKICITGHWDQEDQVRVYSCPQCRQTFSQRPTLAKNTILAEVMEKLKKRKLPDDCYAGAGDVQCDVCTGRKHKAVKSCLECLNSYCQSHLEQHESFFKVKRHKVTDATGRLQEMICQKHDKLLEVFCRNDQKFICVLCMMDEHKNHDTVSAAAQRTEKQKQLKETQRSFQQRIQQREKDLQQLREAVKAHKRSAQTAVEDSERIFTELIRSIERSRSEATQRIRDQEKTAVQPYSVQPYPDHPDRFDDVCQVLCRESVCGHCYWEIEWSGVVDISVSYKSISRKGRSKKCVFGRNDQSWSLSCSSSSYSFIHNDRVIKLHVKSISRRIGVYVDHRAGTLSFYSVSGDTMSLIHTVQTTFTQPLYPGFWVCSGSSVKLC